MAISNEALLQVAVLRDDFRLEPQNTRVAQGNFDILFFKVLQRKLTDLFNLLRRNSFDGMWST